MTAPWIANHSITPQNITKINRCSHMRPLSWSLQLSLWSVAVVVIFFLACGNLVKWFLIYSLLSHGILLFVCVCTPMLLHFFFSFRSDFFLLYNLAKWETIDWKMSFNISYLETSEIDPHSTLSISVHSVWHFIIFFFWWILDVSFFTMQSFPAVFFLSLSLLLDDYVVKIVDWNSTNRYCSKLCGNEWRSNFGIE